MKKLTREDGASPDLVADNIERLREIFPEVFAEGRIDFDALKQALGEAVDEREERYSFTWHGKRRAKQIAQTPSTGTLRPCPEESVNWETTKNIFIEGDNLEVLKLLQKSYHRKVKMIYIDPPYNTGNEFIYPDKWQDNLDTYLRYTGQVDDEGFKMSANAETSGRYHTNWLNMMYPRLRLARNLLRDDGAIFVSIDDNECGNLEQIMNELFGSENFVGRIVWEKVYTPKSNGRVLSADHDYILIYCKAQDFFSSGWNLLPRSDEQNSRFSNPNNDPKGPWRTYPLDVRTENAQKREKYRYEVITPSGRVVKPSAGRHWALPLDRFEEERAAGRIYFGKNNDAMPARKVYLSEARDGVLARTWWPYKEVGGNQTAKQELIELLGGDSGFLTPKPVSLVTRILQISATKDSLVLDFFAGSCSTADAILRQNATDGGKRRFIAVQLPEPCSSDLAVSSSGFATIAEIGKQRIRNVIARILSGNLMKEQSDLPGVETEAPSIDLGFKVLKLSNSNIKPWDADFDSLDQDLVQAVDNIKPDRTEDDVLYELLLKYGLDLAIPTETRHIEGRKVTVIGAGALIVCLADDITLDVVSGIVAMKTEFQPEVMRVVFKDAGFKDDVVKTNAAQILKQAGIDDVKSL